MVVSDPGVTPLGSGEWAPTLRGLSGEDERGQKVKPPSVASKTKTSRCLQRACSGCGSSTPYRWTGVVKSFRRICVCHPEVLESTRTRLPSSRAVQRALQQQTQFGAPASRSCATAGRGEAGCAGEWRPPLPGALDAVDAGLLAASAQEERGGPVGREWCSAPAETTPDE